MIKNFKWVTTIVIAAVFQTTWPDMLRLQGVTPDLTLLIVVYFAITEGEERAMFTGVIGGIYQDTVTNTVLGHHVFGHVIVAYAVGRISTRFVTEHPAVKAGSVLCAALVDGFFHTIIRYVQEPRLGFFYTLLTSVVPTAFYTAVLTPLVFTVLGRVFAHEARVQGGSG